MPSEFRDIDLPAPSSRPAPRDHQVRALLAAGRRGYDYAQRSGPTEWSGARNEHENKLVGVFEAIWPVLAGDQGVALLPELPPVPDGERYHGRFASRRASVTFDMPAQRLVVIAHGAGPAETEQALLAALAMVRAGAALGPQVTGRAEVPGQTAHDLPPSPA